MTKGLTHAIVVGPTKSNGVACEHFAFMGPRINWEKWIDSGKSALRRRVALTYKEAQNFPRFMVELFDWNFKPRLGARQFVPKKPGNVKQVEFDARVEQKNRVSE